MTLSNEKLNSMSFSGFDYAGPFSRFSMTGRNPACEIRRHGPLILKSDWLFSGQYFPVF